MLKKVVILALVLALVLASAQLAVAQQDTQPSQMQATHEQRSGADNTSGTQTTSGEQTAPPPDLTQQSGENQTSPAGGPPADPLPAENNQNDLMHLNKKNKLVVDCAAVDDALAQPQGAASSTPSDLQAQVAQAELKELSRLCKDSRFVPDNSSGGTPGVSSSQDTTIPPQSHLNGSTPSPTGTSYTPPQQTGGTSSGG